MKKQTIEEPIFGKYYLQEVQGEETIEETESGYREVEYDGKVHYEYYYQGNVLTGPKRKLIPKVHVLIDRDVALEIIRNRSFRDREVFKVLGRAIGMNLAIEGIIMKSEDDIQYIKTPTDS